MPIDPEIANIFNVLKQNKNIADKVWMGDDLTMDSVAPYGIPSGIPELDFFMGGKGGYPVGKIIEFYGFQMCGKTTAAYQAAAEWQKRGGLVVFIDTEKSFDPGRSRELGCEPAGIIVLEADTIEQIFDHILNSVLEPLKEAGFKKDVLIIVDSVNGVPSQADVEGNIDESDRPGFEGKQIKRGCKKINPILSDFDFNPTIIFINHAYASIGRNAKTDSGGGHGIKFYASVRILFTNLTVVREKEERTGQKVLIQIVKLKGAPNDQDKFEILLTNDNGFDRYLSLRDVMVKTGYADRPKGSQTLTIRAGTDKAVGIKNVDFEEWVNTNGGYDKVYLEWREWAIKNDFIRPWGQ